MKLRILGCGTSSGVPRVGNDWGACDPAEPRNRRTRASILIESADARVLVDTGPDLREQLLAARVGHLDAVVWTHDHADHCHGIDDLRQIYHARGSPVPGYARPPTLDTLERRFGYILAGREGYPPAVAGAVLPDRLTIRDLAIAVVDQPHGTITSAGLRFEATGRSICYATDFHAMTAEMVALYRGCDVLVIDTLRRAPHPTHPTLEQSLGWIAALRPGRAVLTHMDLSMDYATLAAELPPGVVPAHDGLEIAP